MFYLFDVVRARQNLPICQLIYECDLPCDFVYELQSDVINLLNGILDKILSKAMLMFLYWYVMLLLDLSFLFGSVIALYYIFIYYYYLNVRKLKKKLQILITNERKKKYISFPYVKLLQKQNFVLLVITFN